MVTLNECHLSELCIVNICRRLNKMEKVNVPVYDMTPCCESCIELAFVSLSRLLDCGPKNGLD